MPPLLRNSVHFRGQPTKTKQKYQLRPNRISTSKCLDLERGAGPRKSTYILRSDTEEICHDQLVDKIFMQMTPQQFETRCTHNKVHFVLNEQEQCNPSGLNHLRSHSSRLGQRTSFHTQSEESIRKGTSEFGNSRSMCEAGQVGCRMI